MEDSIRRSNLSLPELFLVAGTRALLGAGVGILVAGRMEPSARKAVGWTLLGIGAITTIPLAIEVFGSMEEQNAPAETASPPISAPPAELSVH